MCVVNETKTEKVVTAANSPSRLPTHPNPDSSPPEPPPRRPIVPYQNVTLNSSDQTFRLEDNYQESQNSTKDTNMPVIHHHVYPTSVNNLRQIHEILRLNKLKLEESGWYYGQMNWYQSTNMLKNTPEGTFLVRDSSDPRFLYTLSVQRGPDEGPTSVRIHFSEGKFRLDAEDKIQHLMPSFTSVVDLVEYYSQINSVAKSQHIWIDMGGQVSPSIWLNAPLLKKVPTLAHSARLTVTRNMKSQDEVQEFKIPFLLTRYLQEYPHTM